MPEKESRPQRRGVKIALIPVLSLVLAWMMFGGKNDDSSSPAIGTLTQPAAPLVQSVPAAKAVAESRARVRPWPDFMLEDLLAHNPFSDGTADIADRAVRSDANEMPDNQPDFGVLAVSVYLHSQRGTVALVDGELVREGQLTEDGRLVEKLTPEVAIIKQAP